MANIKESTLSNVFYQARIRASKHNDALSSRDGAADLMAIDRGRLYRIENDVANPYPEEVHLMANLYNAPYLRNMYCTKCCNLGKYLPEADPTANLDRITVKAIATLRNVTSAKDDLLTIMEDGQIQDDEVPILGKIIETMDELNKVTINLKNWIQEREARK